MGGLTCCLPSPPPVAAAMTVDCEEEESSKTGNIFGESEKKESHTMRMDTIRGGKNSLGSVNQSRRRVLGA